jgi:hypothetical protein
MTSHALAGVFQDQEKKLLSERRYPCRVIIHLTDGVPDNPDAVKKAVKTLNQKGVYVATLGIGLNSYGIAHLEQTYPVWANVGNVLDIDGTLMAIGQTLLRQQRPRELPDGQTSRPVFAGRRMTQSQIDHAGAGTLRR